MGLECREELERQTKFGEETALDTGEELEEGNVWRGLLETDPLLEECIEWTKEDPENVALADLVLSLLLGVEIDGNEEEEDTIRGETVEEGLETDDEGSEDKEEEGFSVSMAMETASRTGLYLSNLSFSSTCRISSR